MTISSDVSGRFFDVNSDGTVSIVNLLPHKIGQIAPADSSVRDSSQCRPHATVSSVLSDRAAPALRKGLWTVDEHQRFLWAMEAFPTGPWKQIATVVQTRTVRQTMVHAQRYADKIKRHRRGLRRRMSAAFPSLSPIFDPLDAWEVDTAAACDDGLVMLA